MKKLLFYAITGFLMPLVLVYFLFMDLINLRFKTSTAWLKLQMVYEDAQKKAFPISKPETNAETIRKEFIKLQKRMERKQLYKW
ncbi:hypothetical protein QM480_09005 [Flectobacillus sp. DC10W]|uniref:Uncharacterized protein n=1 Tax=Flectobacillus longus TaxID=2984207 RepID=A0ABT6YLV5_9BACT|nr:hypothetical protein [Flectobacillus longus]MDI9864462.1 hypothetical protein [Flectobacillus longus]